MNDWTDWLEPELIGGVLGALVFVVLFVGVVQSLRVDAYCKSIGWREGEIAWNFTGYCITRNDQTDEVVPWKQATKR
jgi:hypothetical protein